MQRYKLSVSPIEMVPTEAGGFYRVAEVSEHVDELNAELEASRLREARLQEMVNDGADEISLLTEQLEHAKRNCSAFENEMGNLQVANGKLEADKKLLVLALKASSDYDVVSHERDTLRDVLALLAPDLKAMAILYAQKGDHTRSQALADICKSVGVL